MKVYKYAFPYPTHSIMEVAMPLNSRILTFRSQGDVPTLWALVNEHLPIEVRKFCLIGTGWPLLIEDAEYVGTALVDNENLVWHLFEVIE